MFRKKTSKLYVSQRRFEVSIFFFQSTLNMTVFLDKQISQKGKPKHEKFFWRE